MIPKSNYRRNMRLFAGVCIVVLILAAVYAAVIGERSGISEHVATATRLPSSASAPRNSLSASRQQIARQRERQRERLDANLIPSWSNRPANVRQLAFESQTTPTQSAAPSGESAESAAAPAPFSRVHRIPIEDQSVPDLPSRLPGSGLQLNRPANNATDSPTHRVAAIPTQTQDAPDSPQITLSQAAEIQGERLPVPLGTPEPFPINDSMPAIRPRGSGARTPQAANPFLQGLPEAQFPSGADQTSREQLGDTELGGAELGGAGLGDTGLGDTEPRLPSDDSLEDLVFEQSPDDFTLPDDDESEAFDAQDEAIEDFDAIDGLPPNRSLNVSDENASDDDSEEMGRDLLLQSARNAARLGDFTKASDRLTEYLRRYPDDADARLEFASVLQKLGRFETATSQFEHLLREFPGNYKIKRRFADLQLELQNYYLAEDALVELLAHPDYRVDAAIDLARLLGWTQRPIEAEQIYEQYLADEYPEDTESQLQLAELLVEINRPGRAMELLMRLHNKNPVDLRVLKLMIVVSALSDNSTAAYDFIEKLRTVQPENVTARNELAKQLLDQGFNREAIMVDQQILAFDPMFMDALLRSVQASMRMYEPASALATLKTLGNPDHPEIMMAKGEYHALVGEYSDAIALYRRAIIQDPNYIPARLGLGHAYLRSGQFVRAAGAFAQVPPGNTPKTNQHYISARLAQARSLAQGRHFDEAIPILDEVTATDTGLYIDQILDAYIDVMSLAKQYAPIITAIQTRLPDVVLQPHRQRKLQAQLGLAMARSGQYSAALQEFESLEYDETDPIPEAVYGKYLALRSLGSPERAEQSLNQHFGLLASDTHLRVRIAELAVQDCDCCLARKVLQRLNRCVEDNIVIANRIGEACMMCASCDDSDGCIPYFIGVLNQSPTNVQAMLGIARVSTRQGNYCQAETYFKRAHASMVDDANLTREAARMYSQWKGPDAALAGYNRALNLTQGEHLYSAAQADPERVVEFEQEFERLGSVGAMVSTEMAAEQLGGWKPLSQINALEGLYALEPTNDSALFQIGQAYSNLNRTQDAIAAYERVLCVNPCNQDARIALTRNFLEMRPQAQVFSGFSHQQGRDDLVAIDSVFAGGLIQMPLGDENEFFQIGYTRYHYEPAGGNSLDGDVITARVQYKPYWWLLLWAQADFAKFDFGFDDRVNFDVGLRHQYLENASYRMVGRQENVIENFESIGQDIHRIGFEIGHNWQATRRWNIDAFYRYWDYSDDNFAHNAGIYTGYTMRFGRQQLRWLTNFDWTDFDEQTVLPNAPLIDGAIHPYFSPENFWFATAGLECKRFLSCNTYKGANQHWVELFLGGRVDNDGEFYAIGRGRVLHDIYNWLTFTAYTDVIQSPVYDLVEAGARLTMRF